MADESFRSQLLGVEMRTKPGPKLGEVMSYPGNEKLKSFLTRYYAISELPVGDPQKISKLEELRTEVDLLRSEVEFEHADDPLEANKGHYADLDNLVMMIGGEVKTLKDLAQTNVKTQDAIEQKEHGPIPTVVLPKDDAELLEKAREAEKKAILDFEATQPIPEVFAILKEKKDPARDTTHALSVLHQGEGVITSLSAEHEEYKKELLSRIQAQVVVLVDSWKEWIAQTYEIGDEIEAEIQSLRKEVTGTAGPIAQSVIDDADQLLQRAEGLVQSPPFSPEQRNAWKTQYLSQIEAIQKEIGVSEKKNTRKDSFLEKIKLLEQGPAAVVQKLHDNIKGSLDPLYADLDALKQEGVFTAEEIMELERKLLIADYVYTKRSLDKTLADNELTEANKDFYLDQDGYVAQFEGGGFNRLTRVAGRLAQLDVSASSTVQTTLEADIENFRKSIGKRRAFLFAALYHKGGIVGTVTEGKATAQIPAGPAPLFPDNQALIASDRPGTALATLELDGVSLRFPGEQEYNPAGPKRKDSLQDFDNPGKFVPIKEFTPSQFGDAKRLLDLMFNNRLHTFLGEKIRKEGRLPSVQEQEIITLFKDYFKNQHLPEWNDTLNERISKASMYVFGYTISPLTVKEAWYSHILKLNQEMLIPGSSQFQDNQIYKANQALTYLLDAVRETATSASDVFRLLMLIGIHSDEATNFWVGQVVDPAKLKKARSIIEKIGTTIAGVSGKDSSTIQHEIGEALKEEGLSDEYKYLVNLPLMETSRTIWGTFPFIPMPMQFALFKDNAGQRLSSFTTEIPIKRFGANSPGRDPRPVTAADYINEDDMIMYELIPTEDLIPGSDLQTWYNNGPNFANFYKLYASGLSAGDLSYDKLALLFNQDKYAGIGLPGGWGEEIRCGSIDAKKAMTRVGVVYVLGTCYSLLMSGQVETFFDLEKKLNEGLGKAVSPDAARAIMIILRKTLGSEAEARTYGKEFGKQIDEFLKFR
ncbi:MAG TPA: hypothetical protein VLH19_01085 [Patescibacteria group bacterium]|nr:hypothetical protein [Patescibacteria group bacterium]